MRLRSIGLAAALAAGLLGPAAASEPAPIAAAAILAPAKEPQLAYRKDRNTLGVSEVFRRYGKPSEDGPRPYYSWQNRDWPNLPQDGSSRAEPTARPAVASAAAPGDPLPVGNNVETRSTPDGGQDLYRIDGKGREVRVTCSPKTPKAHSSIHGNRGMIVYSAFDGKQWQLWLATPSSSLAGPEADAADAADCNYANRQLTFGAGDRNWPSWVPGTDFVVFSGTKDNALGSIYLLEAIQGSASLAAPEEYRLTTGDFADGKPSVGIVGDGGVADVGQGAAAGSVGCPGCRGTALWVVFSTNRYRADGSLAGFQLGRGGAALRAQAAEPLTVSSLWQDQSGFGVAPDQGIWQSDESAWEPGWTFGGEQNRIAFSSKRSDPAGDIFQAGLYLQGDDWNDARLIADPEDASAVADRPGVAESHPTWISRFQSGDDAQDRAIIGYTVPAQDARAMLGPVNGGTGSVGGEVPAVPGDAKTAADAGEPAFTPDGGTLLWSQRTKDGRKIGQLTGPTAAETPTLLKYQGQEPHDWLGEPAISPDGKRIAFSRISTLGRARVFVGDYAADGTISNLSQLPAGTATGKDWSEASPSFSPDSRKLVLSRIFWGADPSLRLADETRIVTPPAFAGVQGWFGRTTVGVHVKNDGDRQSEPTAVELNAIRNDGLPALTPDDLSNIPQGCLAGSTPASLRCKVPSLAPGTEFQFQFDVYSGTSYGFKVFGSVDLQAGDYPRNNVAELNSPYVKETPGPTIPPAAAAGAAAPSGVVVPPPAPGAFMAPRPQLWVADLGSAEVSPITQGCALRSAGCPIVDGASPAWGSDGRIAYQDREVLHTAAIDQDGTAVKQQQLTGIFPEGKPTASRTVLDQTADPAWSSDGKELLFTGQPAGRPSNKGIYALDASNGAGLRTVAQTAWEESQPAARPAKAPDPAKPVDPKAADLLVALNLDRDRLWLGGKAVPGKAEIRNDSDAPAKGVVVDFAASPELSISAEGCAGTHCELGELAAQQSRTITLTVTSAAKGSGQVSVKAVSSGNERDYTNNTVERRLTVLETTVRLLPSVAKPGDVVLAYLENLPPGETVRLAWEQGINSGADTYASAQDNLTVPVLVVPGDQLGDRTLRVHSTTGGFGGADGIAGNLLVVPGAMQPPGFLGRG
ncbi:hypothetical protein [Arthrobacter russicus]|uniref:Tol biopolymer transport system component n=2 Tax=Bacteria TaxID=2 RepID=A0ABU1J6S9_9MICC|nr:hypothetical protein [Arthrobacter russicus]MDR6268134.1 Tol biopolymer transport system component [Arthrobacter russicus]